MTDILAQYDINTKDLKEAMAPIQPCVQTPSVINHASIQPFFAWMTVERIWKTFEKTTQFMRIHASTYLRKRHRSANPATNVYCCWEADATDTIFSNTPAVDDGEKVAQFARNTRTRYKTGYYLSEIMYNL